MSVEGRLTIDLDRAADGSGRAAIASSRPLGLARVFVGKTADETVRTLPVLFNVCGLAQGTAAAQACERALSIEVGRQTQCIRQLLVGVETLREHLVRAVMDWPRFLGQEPETDDMLRAMRLCMRLRRTLDPDSTALAIGGWAQLDAAKFSTEMAEMARLIEELVLGEPLEAWRVRTTAARFAAWAAAARTPSQRLVRHVLDEEWADAGRAETRFLPDVEDDDLAERLLGEGNADFVATPTWDGTPCETSALARQAESPLVRALKRSHGSGLLTRIAARLVEIADLPQQMTTLAEHSAALRSNAPETARPASAKTGSGRGLAQVEAARGRLAHGVEIEDNIVRRYAILAPTEWNFHGGGAAVRGLADIAGRNGDVRALADLFITAVDPCVGYELKVH
jgi:coenzyme F420-reducing hydrogenase alpha subunit